MHSWCLKIYGTIFLLTRLKPIPKKGQGPVISLWPWCNILEQSRCSVSLWFPPHGHHYYLFSVMCEVLHMWNAFPDPFSVVFFCIFFIIFFCGLNQVELQTRSLEHRIIIFVVTVATGWLPSWYQVAFDEKCVIERHGGMWHFNMSTEFTLYGTWIYLG